MRVKGIWIVGGVVVLGLLYLGFGLCIQEKKESNLEDARAEAVSVGMPVSAADLVRYPAVAPEDNAAIELKELYRLVEDDKARYSGLFDELIYSDLDFSLPEERDKARAAMEELKPFFELYKTASEKPDCDFQRDYSDGLATMYPELYVIKMAARVFGKGAELMTHEEDLDGALDSISTVLSVTKHLKNQPGSITKLAAIAIENIAFKVIQSASHQWGADPQFWEGVNTLFEPTWRELDLQAIVGHKAVEFLETLGTFNEQDPRSEGWEEEHRLPQSFVNELLIDSLEYWSTVYRMTSDPEVDLAELDRLADEFGITIFGWTLLGQSIPMADDLATDVSVSADFRYARASNYAMRAMLFVMTEYWANGSAPAQLPAKFEDVPFDGATVTYDVQSDSVSLKVSWIQPSGSMFSGEPGDRTLTYDLPK